MNIPDNNEPSEVPAVDAFFDVSGQNLVEAHSAGIPFLSISADGEISLGVSFGNAIARLIQMENTLVQADSNESLVFVRMTRFLLAREAEIRDLRVRLDNATGGTSAYS